MAFDALKHRYIAEIQRVFEWLVGLMTGLAFSIAESAKIHRVLESRDLYRGCGILRVIDDRVTDVAVVPNNLAAIANVLSIVTPETTRRVKVTDVVRSEEHTSELQSQSNLVCRLLLE